MRRCSHQYVSPHSAMVSAERDGSGLGLAIAQWAAQAHSGEVRVQREPSAGSAFELWLPAPDAPDTPARLP